MTTYLVAAALSALLFVTFVAFARRGCGDPTCGTHARCAGCPNAPPTDAFDSPERSA